MKHTVVADNLTSTEDGSKFQHDGAQDQKLPTIEVSIPRITGDRYVDKPRYPVSEEEGIVIEDVKTSRC